jgi:acetylornithine aminotransferase/acetylornithine/N-succinyldiaminopimelate aminotransferase
MIGAEMKSAEIAKEVADKMLYEKHILINRTSDTVLRFLPPYLITKADVDETIAALSGLIADAEAAQAVLAGEQVHG